LYLIEKKTRLKLIIKSAVDNKNNRVLNEFNIFNYQTLVSITLASSRYV